MVREYALEQLAASGEHDEARRRHLAHFTDLAEAAAPRLHGSQQDAWIARLSQEHQNLRDAVRWATEAGDGEHVFRLVGSLYRF